MESASNSQPDQTIKPLTHRTKDGELYHRPQDVEDQIRWTLTLPFDQNLNFARLKNSKEPKFLKEETLVYLILAYRRVQARDMVNQLSEILVERIARRFRSLFPYSDDPWRAEAGDELISSIFDKILSDQDGRADYFQIRFWACVKKLAITLSRKKSDVYDQKEKILPLSNLAGYEMEEPEKTNSIDSETQKDLPVLSVQTIPIEDVVIANDGLCCIEEPMRTAFMLTQYGWQIESLDPTEPTISKYFSVTPKTIRNWLAKAEKDLESWRGGSHG